MIIGTDLMSPEPDMQAVYESFPQKLIEKILNLDYRPDAVEFRTKLLLGLSRPFLRHAGCTPVLVEHMPLMNEAIESLLEHLK